MTTDQVVVYGGNDGTAETYNTVTVDRGDGPGQEQLVQQVGYAASTTGSLVLEDDVVSVETTGMAGATFVLSGTYTPDGSAGVYFERTFDGVLWVEVSSSVTGATTTFNSFLTLVGDSTYIAQVPTNGAATVRVRLGDGALLAGAVDVCAAAQPVEPSVQTVRVASSATVPVSIGGTTQVSVVAISGASGNLAALDESVLINSVTGAVIQVTGDLVGTLVAEMSINEATWFTVADAWLLDIGTGVSAPLDALGLWLLNIDGPILAFRIRCSAYTSGTATVLISGSTV